MPIRSLNNPETLAFVRFVLVGAMNTGFAYLAYAGFLLIGFQPWSANLGALILGILFSYTSISKLVFGVSGMRMFLRFVASWFIIYGVQTGIIYGLIHLGLGALLAGLVVLPVAALASFFVQRFIVFRRG